MLETPEARARLRRKMETWPDDRKCPVTINQGLELLDIIEQQDEKIRSLINEWNYLKLNNQWLNREADWLAAAQNGDVPCEDPSRCPEGKEPPTGCIGINDCTKCWREAAGKAVREAAVNGKAEGN